MGKEQRRVAKAQLVAGMQAGYSWQTAAAQAGLQTIQSTAYRLMKAFRQHGEMGLSDGRHGHRSKLRGEVRTLLARTLPTGTSDARFNDSSGPARAF
jgi:transposase